MSIRMRTLAIGAAVGAAAIAVPATVAWGVSTATDDDGPVGRGGTVARQVQQGGMGGMMTDDADDAWGAGGMRARSGSGTAASGAYGDGTCLLDEAAVADGSSVDADDAASLTFMVQEEKLARDLYTALDELWGLRVLDRVADAEQQHMDAVSRLLDAYGVADPTEEAAAGELSDPALQDLYDALLAQGSTSVTAALGAAALVEETDIADLRDQDPESAAVASVYAALESASEQHLAAFVRQLDARGVDYAAQVLDPADVEDITGVPAP
ncbi:DUF2202 domain-containing protein [Demequina sp. SYSU T00068]|uniref:DUF2202 domain-containing protein n=1 Tax=Demequina lignilytica TaxID=3051663 RepID=UPI0026069C47|nr:DUF2202 domain-containing protein [Demequina sp. SYSU T00068]MDN4491346.1 DUF2202 domain-containing protein [Demequina sp. SYSU T00068]